MAVGAYDRLAAYTSLAAPQGAGNRASRLCAQALLRSFAFHFAGYNPPGCIFPKKIALENDD
eukprot:671622-Pelagomonas_calceolata.AAC.11